MLEVERISKTYPGENLGAVKNVSFQVAKGEVLSIIGESGCGKTTLLRMLAGLMKPDSGSISINGELLKNPEKQLIPGHPLIKMVFQDYNLKPNMSIEENIKYMLLDYDDTFKEEKTAQLLGLCGLTILKNRKPNELSGGQQQRVSLARALADEPELILMDEPFSNIDPVNKQKLLLEIQKITKELEVAVVFVSHDTRDALMISDRVGFMQQGQLIQIDTPELLYNSPKIIELARFLGVVNEFEVEDLQVFGISEFPKGKSIAVVRAYLLKLDRQGVQQVEIVDCKFSGPNYLVKSITQNGKVLNHFHESRIDIGSKFFISIVPKYLIYF